MPAASPSPRSRAGAAAAAAPVAPAPAPVAVASLPFALASIPVPPRSGGGGGALKYPFETMEMGTAFFVPYGAASPKQVMNRMTGAVTRAKKSFEDVNYSARHYVDEGNVFGHGANAKGVGIWRVPVAAPKAPKA